MKSVKQGSSETSSDENDQEEQVKEDTGTAAKRSYECTFCKRGFTNAQALGGHMNIHRKDRAKAKQVTGSSASSKVISEDFMNPSNLTPISSEPTNYYPVSEAHQRSYHMTFQPSGSGPRQPLGYYHGSDFLVPRSQSLSVNEELWGANLSLQIGSTHVEELKGDEVLKEDEVDLELRLGHNP